eukprot:TRINITY_DN16345_c0_g1_i1.p1 TRINITY_DN16345_c0_g1~~TRINITY_DN16345_c0_g1_i1.p1  ORF type:complete len:564 (+),score=199.01 TRINITY_DN16345_c0_g1_i1:73-1764(+)
MEFGTPPPSGEPALLHTDADTGADGARAARGELDKVADGLARAKKLVEWLKETEVDDERLAEVKDEAEFELRLEFERMVCYVRDARKGVHLQEEALAKAEVALSSARAKGDDLATELAKCKEKAAQGPILAARAARNLLMSGGETVNSPRQPAAASTPSSLIPHRPRAKPNTLPSLPSRVNTPPRCEPGCGCGPGGCETQCPHREMMANRIIDGVFDAHTTLLRQRLKAAEEELKRWRDGSEQARLKAEAAAKVKEVEAKMQQHAEAAEAERQALTDKVLHCSRRCLDLEAQLADAAQRHRKQMTDTAVAAQQVLDRLRTAQQDLRDEREAADRLRDELDAHASAQGVQEAEAAAFARFARGVRDWGAQFKRAAQTFRATCKRGGKGREWQELFPKDASAFFGSALRRDAGASPPAPSLPKDVIRVPVATAHPPPQTLLQAHGSDDGVVALLGECGSTDGEATAARPPRPEPPAIDALAACQADARAAFEELAAQVAELRAALKEHSARLAMPPEKAPMGAHAYGGGESSIQRAPILTRDSASMHKRHSIGAKDTVVVRMNEG